ncbi:MAG: archaeosortase/exosortase family protein, partial [Proteobacteria bacterium]|nr:archaeosortase/exosortase family protein [Pseudomonadota bacterium]
MINQWSKEDFSYSYLVPLIVLYLLWEKKDKLKTVVSNPGWFGLAVLLSGISLFWLGELGGEFYTIYLS